MTAAPVVWGPSNTGEDAPRWFRPAGTRMTAWLGRQLRAPFAPSAGAVLFFWAALTPSLLPRSPIFQGAVAAVAVLLGYGLGSLLGWVVRSCGGALTGTARRRAWLALATVAAIGTIVGLVAYFRWRTGCATSSE